MIGDLLNLTRTRLGKSIPLKRRPMNPQQVCEEAMVDIPRGPLLLIQLLQSTGQRHFLSLLRSLC